MQVASNSHAREREHEKPMSWARAVLIAIGFFFLAAILVGQFPSYIFTVSTGANLQHMSQGFFDIAILSIGLGLLCFTVSMLYDPRPLIPWPLFAAAGLVIAVLGLYTLYQVWVGVFGTNLFGVGGWNGFLPEQLTQGSKTVDWPVAGQTYLLNPAWLQLESIDLRAVGMMATLTGFGMFGFAALNPLVLGGKLVGPVRDLLTRLSLGLSLVILAVWLTGYTFYPDAILSPTDRSGAPLGNIFLFVALMLALFALQVWLLPVMVANRQQFMPGVYLHGVVGLIGSVGVPFLVIWALIYPVVDLIHNFDSAQFWVSCADKTSIPATCTFTPYTGYIICAIVFGAPFTLLAMGLYFWSTRRNTVVLGGTIGLIWVALAATLVHVSDPAQLPIGILLATGIVVMAYVWSWGNQREFAPTYAEQLGCTGQWLMLGTLMLVYMAGFAFFSLPNFFEVEALGLFYSPGPGGLHDAFWGIVLMGGLAAFQFALLMRRRSDPLSNAKKFAMWAMLIAIVFEIAGAIIGFHNDILATGINGMEGAHGIFVAGLCFEIIGIVVTFFSALEAKSVPWMLTIGVSILIGAALAFVMYNLPIVYPELVVAGIISAMVGAFAYVAAGPEAVDVYEVALLNAGFDDDVTGFAAGQ